MSVKVAYLRAVFTYDPDTGQFFRLRNRGYILTPPLEIAGPVVQLQGRTYRTDRIIWHYVYGRWPVGKVVHMNGDENDHSIGNLAEKAFSPVPGKLIGAHFNRRTQRWYAMISRNGKNKSLGTFATAQEAHEAYLEARKSGEP